MGYSLVSARPYSPVIDVRSSGEQSKGTCSKYNPVRGIESCSSLYRWVSKGIQLSSTESWVSNIRILFEQLDLG